MEVESNIDIEDPNSLGNLRNVSFSSVFLNYPHYNLLDS